MKKRAAATGGATSLLEPEQLVDSLPGSAATSRAASPLGDDEDDAEKAGTVGDQDADAKAPEAEQAEAEHPDTAEAHRHPTLPSTRTTLPRTKPPSVVKMPWKLSPRSRSDSAMLRDRLYVERLQEISKEGDMILDGTHPELLHLTKAIEMPSAPHRIGRDVVRAARKAVRTCRQSRRVRFVELLAIELCKPTTRYDGRVQHETQETRSREAFTRCTSAGAKHQIFETEWCETRSTAYFAGLFDTEARGRASGTERLARKPAASSPQSARRRARDRAGDEFVAYTDLKGLADADIMMDIEQMGIRPGASHPACTTLLRRSCRTRVSKTPRSTRMYGPEAAAAAAAAAAAQAPHER